MMQKKKLFFARFFDFGHSIKLLKIGAKKEPKIEYLFFITIIHVNIKY